MHRIGLALAASDTHVVKTVTIVHYTLAQTRPIQIARPQWDSRCRRHYNRATTSAILTKRLRRKVTTNRSIRLLWTMSQRWWISRRTCNGPNHCSATGRRCQHGFATIGCEIHGRPCTEAHHRCVTTIVFRRMHRVQCRHHFIMDRRHMAALRPYLSAWIHRFKWIIVCWIIVRLLIILVLLVCYTNLIEIPNFYVCLSFRACSRIQVIELGYQPI